MRYASSAVKGGLLKMDEFVFKPSQQNHVVANWKLYFRNVPNPIPAETIATAIENVVSGETHKKFMLRSTPRISEANKIYQNLKYFQV